MVTLPLTRAFCNTAELRTEPSVIGSNGVAPDPSPLAVFAAALIVKFAGSSNHVPPLPPSAAFASTRPNACRLSCELVSINPPLPAPLPALLAAPAPLASMLPKKPVYSLLHTITRPPSPLLVALAVMRASVPMTVRLACGALAALLPR